MNSLDILPFIHLCFLISLDGVMQLSQLKSFAIKTNKHTTKHEILSDNAKLRPRRSPAKLQVSAAAFLGAADIKRKGRPRGTLTAGTRRARAKRYERLLPILKFGATNPVAQQD